MLTTSRPSLRKKAAKYVTEGLELDVPNLSLPRMWFGKVPAKRAEGTGEVVPTAVMPHLVLVAHLDVGTESTGCHAECNVSALSSHSQPTLENVGQSCADGVVVVRIRFHNRFNCVGVDISIHVLLTRGRI